MFRQLGTACAMLMGAATLAQAATFTVDSPADAVDATPGDGVCATAAGACSLRAAIQEANASAGADLIQLPAGSYILSVAGADEDAAASGDLDINSELTLQGAGAGSTAIDGLGTDRVFHIHPGAQATLRAITIRNGRPPNNSVGGGVDNRGTLTLSDCNIERNVAAGFGGGIYNAMGMSSTAAVVLPTLVLERCTVSNNVTQGNGGGIANIDGVMLVRDSSIRDNAGGRFPGVVMGGGIYNFGFNARLTVERSTISGHSVYTDGGGIYHGMGTLELTNVTLSGNSARRNGGGLFNGNTATGNGVVVPVVRLVNVTLSNNGAEAADSSTPSTGRGGGGIYNRPGARLSLVNSIIASNLAGHDCYNDTGGMIQSLGHNLDGDGSCGLTATSDIAGGTADLAALANNGGPTQTQALLAGSDAIDAGLASACPATDQRGFERVGVCDIGAFEYGAVASGNEPAPPPPNTTVTPIPNRAPQAFNLPLAVTAGSAVEGVLNAFDADGDPLTYAILQAPSKGRVGLASGGIPGSFDYVAYSNSTGVDSFTFRVCDNRTPKLCSTPATVSIVITAGTAVQTVALKVQGGGSSSGPIQVTPATLAVLAPDIDFSYPLGAYFFNVQDVPTDPNTPTVVTLQLPASATIPADAVVRKLDKTGVWRTLESGSNPAVSTATLDPVNRTITLVLRDNDMFDLDPAVGSISDPVALGVESASAASSDGGSGAVDLLSAAALLAVGLRRCRRQGSS